MNMNIFLWGVLPYVVIALLVGGTFWRYKFDKFGWTTRSSQVYESKLLRVGSPMFHLGLVFVVGGHVIGLVIPKSWTEFFYISDHMYHITALSLGTAAGILTVAGLAILIYRRRTNGPVFIATTRNDKLMYVVLGLTLCFGLWITVASFMAGDQAHEFDYRESVSPWFRSVFLLQPEVELMAGTPLPFRAHVLMAMFLFALWPFTRLVHAFTAPLHYLFRPYIVYRTRDSSPAGARTPKRGWEPIGTGTTLVDKKKKR